MTSEKSGLHLFHQSLYQSAKSRALSYPSFQQKSIKVYAHDFYQSLPDQFDLARQEDVVSNMKDNHVVLYGDFHTLKQTQNGFFHILKLALTETQKRPLVVGLEMFKHIHQEILDQFLLGKIEDKELLEQTGYLAEWGFPWDHYSFILEFAKQHKIKILGLNSPKGGRDGLHKRDSYAAKIIEDHLKREPEALILALIGEYHLADGRLPKLLQNKEIKVSRIFTNIDEYYFNRPDHSRLHTEYLYLKDNTFCILNSPPWVKWQSYCLWEELRATVVEGHELEYDDDEFTIDDEGFDVEFHIHDLGKKLSEFLKIPLSLASLSQFSVEVNPGHDLMSQLKRKGYLKAPEFRHAVDRLASHGFFFVSAKNMILLTEVSLNNLAKLAGQYLHGICSQSQIKHGGSSDQFVWRCLNYCSGELSARILNPKRKSRGLNYFHEFLAANLRKQLSIRARNKRRAFTEVLRLFDRLHNPRLDKTTWQKYSKVDQELDHCLSHYFGELLGDMIYNRIFIEGVQEERQLVEKLYLNKKRDTAKAVLLSIMSSLIRSQEETVKKVDGLVS